MVVHGSSEDLARTSAVFIDQDNERDIPSAVGLCAEVVVFHSVSPLRRTIVLRVETDLRAQRRHLVVHLDFLRRSITNDFIPFPVSSYIDLLTSAAVSFGNS